jgi:hypothetical protein
MNKDHASRRNALVSQGVLDAGAIAGQRHTFGIRRAS